MIGSYSSGEMSFGRTIEALESIDNRQVDVLIKEIWDSNSTIIWNRGIGRESGMLRFLQRLTEKALQRITNFDFIIHLHMPSILEPNGRREHDPNIINRRVVQAISDALDLMNKDNSKLRKLKTELEEEAYYTYSPVNEQKESELIKQMKANIYQTLKGRRYLLVTEELDEKITYPKFSWLMESWFPGSRFGSNRAWNDDCWWLITLARSAEYDKNQGGILLDLNDLFDRYDQVFSPVFIFEQELYVAAKSISSDYCMEIRRIMDILWSCLLYTAVIRLGDWDEPKDLIRMWVAEGLLSRDIKLRHVGSASLAEELNVLMSYDEEGEEASEKEEDNLTNDRYSQLFGLAETIFNALTTHSLVGPPFGDNFIWTLLEKWKSLYKRCNVNLNHWSSDRWGSVDAEYLVADANKNKNKYTWISLGRPMRSYSTWAYWVLYPKPKNTTFFCQYDIGQALFEPIDRLLCSLSHLQVLKLSFQPIQYLPESLSGLTNLRLLSIHRCYSLRSLGTANSSISSPIGSLEKLEVLDLVGVYNLREIPDDLGNKKHRLYFLRISSHNITSLPPNLFNDMPNLRELVLDSTYGSKLLTGLSPLASLTNLETLSLSNTKLVSLPPDTFEKMQRLRVLKLIDDPLLETLSKSLCDAEMLQEVQISGCTSLKEIKMNGNIGIRSFSLSDSPITSLSLCGCRELAVIYLKKLKELEDLNLNFTAITEIPDISDCSRLRQLHLQVVPNLRRAPWHKLDHIPEVLNLDQSDFTDPIISGLDAHGKINQGKLSPEIVVGVRIFVRDSQLFLSLGPKHCTYLFGRGSLQSFYILVASCEKRKEAFGTSQSQTLQFAPIEWSCYKDATLKTLAPKPLFVQQQQQCHRHVEISSTERYPRGLEGILEITESLSMKDNIHISSVSDLNARLPMLLALQIEGCYKIESLFNATDGESVCPQLLDFSVAHLHNMRYFLIEKGTCFLGKSFCSLKHLHLSQCQRLKSIFPDNVLLPSLEMLDIMDCTSLETVFYKSGYYAFDADMVMKFRENHLRSLHTMRLYLLPQLLLIHEEQRVGALLMPNWKTLLFRECWGLCQMPLLTGSRDEKVCVHGESKKCSTIKAQMDTEQLSHYEFRPKPPFASVKDGVKNKIFLK